jgi:uncharacterized protein (TIGR02246 family)
MTTKPEMIALVERYFAAVDAKDIEGTLACYTPDCQITVETAGVQVRGRDGEIREMIEQLFERMESMWHGEYHHVVDEEAAAIASQFVYRSRTADGASREDHNCNFATVEDDRFSTISTYMTQNLLA